jgi:hypothetical protein
MQLSIKLVNNFNWLNEPVSDKEALKYISSEISKTICPSTISEEFSFLFEFINLKDNDKRIITAYRSIRFASSLSKSHPSILENISKENGISQNKLANLLNISQSKVCSIVHKKNNYLQPKLCKKIFELYLKINVPEWARDLIHYKKMIDSKINKEKV